MANKTVIEGSSVTAAQMKDFWRQIDDGSITRQTLQSFLDHRNVVLPIHAVEFDPEEFIGEGWRFDTKDADPRSLKLTVVDFSEVIFDTCFNEGTRYIFSERIFDTCRNEGEHYITTGDEKLRRLIAEGNIRLDPRFAVALFQEEGHKTLERLYKEHGVSYVDFFGQILLDSLGRRCFLCLDRDDRGRWGCYVPCLDRDRYAGGVSAVLAS